jgi:hypothetical protein
VLTVKGSGYGGVVGVDGSPPAPAAGVYLPPFRACPLCHGCRNGAHTQHKPAFEATIPSSAGTRKVTLQCDCPICQEAA